MVTDLFLHEYLGRPENRVNVALFAMLQQHWFREWFLKKLDLESDSIVYPPSNRNYRRPDLKVMNPTNLDAPARAWIEVELSKDNSQLTDYRKKLHPDPVKSLWGKHSHHGDLSLEEVAEYLSRQQGLHPQVAVNVQQLVELIREGLQGHSSPPGRSTLSPEMKDHPLVAGPSDILGSKMRFDLRANESPCPCYLKVDTTDTKNNRGFSLRVYSPVSRNGTLSVVSISGQSKDVRLPSLKKLKEYLPHCLHEVEAYQSVLLKLGIKPKFGIRQLQSLCCDTAVDHLDELVPHLKALADCYGNCVE